MDRSVLLISTYNAVRKPWNGVPFEFYNIISQIENATIVAPPATGPDPATASSPSGILKFAAQGLAGQARRAMGKGFAPQMAQAGLDAEYDLCLFMCQFTRELTNIDQVRDWRARSKFAVAFVLETWSSQFEKRKADLRILDQFDHVFVLNASSAPELKRYTSTPVSFLPTAADSLAAIAPAGETVPMLPDRVIDFFSMGRRRAEVHDLLMEKSRTEGAFYIHDIWTGILARDWAEARAGNADMVRRSRYYIAWDPVAVSPTKDEIIGNERAISTRYFEGSAGGAVLLGSRPTCPEFDALFDWPDAVVEIAPEGTDLHEVLGRFEADPERVRAVREANITNALRRHDWAFRWEEILGTAGLAPSEAHVKRVDKMAHLADQIRIVSDRPSTYRVAAGE
ncbi:glycosyltransferase family protein [Amaricoccus macauensis]|uniref:glycosyltransferase n=1 Tax=Amaricoccus macauensis TaxID=57001 RepID=UPI003C798E4B